MFSFRPFPPLYPPCTDTPLTANNTSTRTGSAKNTHSPDSSLSDPSHHPSKRQRTRSGSVSSLSEQEEDEDDEDRPLATRVPNYQPVAMSSKIPLSPTRARGRGGKKGPSHGVMKVPTEQPHASMDGLHLNGSARVVNGGVELEMRVKLEDRVDEGQLSRLATGVAVDGGTTVPATSAVGQIRIPLRSMANLIHPPCDRRRMDALKRLSTLKCGLASLRLLPSKTTGNRGRL